MAQFLKAKFLSQALEWKFRFPDAPFYGGLRFDPYIYKQARKTFSDYDKLYPDDKNFTEKFVRDLRSNNPQLIKQINPDILTPEMSAENTLFEAEAATEQLQVAQTTGQPVTQTFSLTSPPPTPVPTMPQIIPQVPTPVPEAPVTTEAAVPEATGQPAAVPQAPITQPPAPPPAVPTAKPITAKPPLQAPRVSPTFTNAARNLGSTIGVFFQKNVGKYLTAGRAATLISGGVGAAVGAGLTNGSLLGAAGGAGIGAIAPSVVRSGSGTKFLSRLGNNAINVGSSISNQVSGGGTGLTMSPTTKRLAWGLIALLFLLILGMGIFGGLGGAPQIGLIPPGASPSPTTRPVSNIRSCTFYRGGDTVPGLQFNITEWPDLIGEVASKVQVPPSLLAAILRVECPNCFATSDPTYITNDYDGHSSGVAYGAMQFTPGTFEGIFSNYAAELQSLFGKTSVTTNIDPQDSMAPADVFRIYSVRDSLIAAAFLIREDKGAGPWNDENTIRDIASMYFSGRRLSDPGNCVKYPDCTDGPFDYGTDLWQSYSTCQTIISPTPGPTTPTLASVLSWDQQILDNLSIGANGLYSRLTTPVSNDGYSTGTWSGDNDGTTYWCTYSVIDAYNLAGITGLSKGSHAAVVTMRQFWQNASGFIFLDYASDNTALNSARPGYAIFMESVPGSYTGYEHVALIRSILVDTRGDGTVTTNDSNSTQVIHQYPVVGWSIKNTPYTITGLGGI